MPTYHLISRGVRILSTSTQPVERIKHSRAQETNKSYHTQLDTRRGIPGDGDGSQLALLVHPSIGTVVVRMILDDGLLVHLWRGAEVLCVSHDDVGECTCRCPDSAYGRKGETGVCGQGEGARKKGKKKREKEGASKTGSLSFNNNSSKDPGSLGR